MQNISNLKLGKLAPKVDNRRLKLAKYITSFPTPPDSVDWTKDVSQYGMMLNGPNKYGNSIPSDGLGNCTCAAVGHSAQVSTLNTPEGESTPADSLILNLYEKVCGYVPGDPNTDRGGIIVDVLNHVRKQGLGVNPTTGHKKFKLHSYADPDPGNLLHIKQAINLFGMVNIGLQLPISAQNQVGNTWDIVGNLTDPNSVPGSWGGHSVIVCGYTPTTLTCITWGALQTMTWNFWAAYVDESHALLFQSWLNRFGAQAPEALKTLEQDLIDISN